MLFSHLTADGNWSPWGEWGSCSTTCGGGVTKRYRSCSDPAPADGGAECEGLAEELEVCNPDVLCEGE